MIAKEVVVNENNSEVDFFVWGTPLTIKEYCKKNNYKFIQIVTTPTHGYQGLFEDLNHHSSELNKELNARRRK